MRTALFLAALLTSSIPALAAAQADPVEEALIQEDHVLSRRLLERSGHDPIVVEFRTELRLLDRSLRGHQRPADTSGAGIAMVVVGGMGFVGGLITLLAGAIRSAAHGVGCSISSLLPSSGACGPLDNSAYWVGGGSAFGAGVLTLVLGLAFALAGRHERAAFDRRDDLREQLRTAMSAIVSPSGDGAALLLATPF